MNRLYDLRCEYMENPEMIDAERPRFSWKIMADGRDIVQSSWEIEVLEAETGKCVWRRQETGRDTLHITYEGSHLEDNRKYFWKVKAELSNGLVLESDEPAYFETGIRDDTVWKGIWIGKKERKGKENCPRLRRTIFVDGGCKRARLFISACGLFTLTVNGKEAGDYVLAPGWTSYSHRQQYLAYDVTKLLVPGKNGIGVRLGDGWYNGEISFDHQTHVYGNDISFAALLYLEYDNHTEVISTDACWKAADSGISFSSIYQGECWNLTEEEEDWTSAEYDDSAWENAVLKPDAVGKMIAMRNEGTKRIEVIRPQTILHTPKGELLIDMGQNMTGWARITVNGKKGDVVHVKYGEILDKDGNFYTGNLRGAKQEDRFVLREGENILEPHFTFHGFRYINILEFPGEVGTGNFEGIVLHTAMAPSMKFSCSNPLVNQLWHNLIWGQKGNFLDVPTDCPQRDERLGWTGDAQIFCATACYNFMADAFFGKWLADVREEQYENGAIPFVVPDVLPKTWKFIREAGIGPEHVSAAWCEAITVCPWTMYVQYGDKRILEECYEAVKKYISYIYSGAKYGSNNPYVWDWGPQLGDWLALDNVEGSYCGGTDEFYVSTAFYAFSAKLASKYASVLGYGEEAKKYDDLFGKIREHFRALYLKNGYLTIRTQTAQILPLHFGLLDPEEEEKAVETLVSLLHKRKDHLDTGFVGTPYLCHVLSRYGHTELAYTLLLQEDYPSWLYQVRRGATTVWEHWDGQREDGSFWSDNMNSFNHYAYGSIGEWLYRCAAGIRADEEIPGFRHIIIQPQTDERMEFLEITYESVCGTVHSGWERRASEVRLLVSIPANTSASVYLENGDRYEIGSGEHEFSYNLNYINNR